MSCSSPEIPYIASSIHLPPLLPYCPFARENSLIFHWLVRCNCRNSIVTLSVVCRRDDGWPAAIWTRQQCTYIRMHTYTRLLRSLACNSSVQVAGLLSFNLFGGYCVPSLVTECRPGFMAVPHSYVNTIITAAQLVPTSYTACIVVRADSYTDRCHWPTIRPMRPSTWQAVTLIALVPRQSVQFSG